MSLDHQQVSTTLTDNELTDTFPHLHTFKYIINMLLHKTVHLFED